jgi:hypothetical protein
MLKAIYRFERDKLLRSSKLIVPLLILIAYIGIAYSIAPLNILSSFSICSLVIFMLLISVGVMDDDLSYSMIEQTILVKIHKKALFYLGRAVLIGVVSMAFSLIAVLLPLLIHLWRGSELFSREIVISDVLSGLALFWLIGLCGGMIGLFANHRIISNRKTAILICIAFGLFTIIKGALVQQAQFLQYITWILPPIHDLSVAYCQDTYFRLGQTWVYFAWLMGYIGIEVFAYVKIMRRRGFE